MAQKIATPKVQNIQKFTIEVEVVDKTWTKVSVKVNGKEIPQENSYVRGELNLWDIGDFNGWGLTLLSAENG